MEQKITIDFVDNATTQEALKYIQRFIIVILRNAWNGIDKAAHRWPWAFIVPIIIASVVTCFVLVAKARAERDHYNQLNVHLQQQVDSYKAAFGEEGGEK